MWDQIIEYMAQNGVWALLFLALLVYQLQDSKKREEKYTGTITSLTEGLSALDGIKNDIKSIIEAIDGTINTVQLFASMGKDNDDKTSKSA